MSPGGLAYAGQGQPGVAGNPSLPPQVLLPGGAGKRGMDMSTIGRHVKTAATVGSAAVKIVKLFNALS